MRRTTMTKQATFLTIFTLSLALIAVPAFAQGKGLGAGVGQAKVGVGGQGRVDAPGVKTGASTDVDSKVKTTGAVKTPGGDKGEGKTDFISKIDANPKLSAKLQALIPGEPLD